MPSRSLIDRSTTGTGPPRRPGVPACGGVSGIGAHDPCPAASLGTQREPGRSTRHGNANRAFESDHSNPFTRRIGVFDTQGSNLWGASRPEPPTPLTAHSSRCTSWRPWPSSHGFRSPPCRMHLSAGASRPKSSNRCGSVQTVLDWLDEIDGFKPSTASNRCGSVQSLWTGWTLWTKDARASAVQKMRFVRANRPIGPTRCGSVQNSL